MVADAAMRENGLHTQVLPLDNGMPDASTKNP
jgi:hypothetical protein